MLLAQGAVRAVAGRNLLILGACACLLAVAARHSAPPAAREIIGAAYKPVADAVAAAVVSRGLDGVAGDYWDVWPAVFQAEVLLHRLGRPAGGVFGLTYRGEARRDAFTARLLQAGRLRFACIGMDGGACSASIQQTMRLPGVYLGVNMELAEPPVTLPDGRALTFITLVRAPAGP